jgi:tryptophanyl-tRNA synthetase
VTADKPVLMTGDRPTGRLHLGHFVGSLVNRVRLQDQYQCLFLVADLHMLTTHSDRLGKVAANVLDMVIDWLSVGMDPRRATFYIQSQVPAITQLYTILGMLCTVPRAQRVPTLKQQAQDLGVGENYSLGLLGYPVLMAADILIFNAAKAPVGEDQLSHLELARELARRFNHLYGPTFNEPDGLLSDMPRLVGTDGRRKMSKSLDNAIHLSDDPKTVEERVRGMYTDPQRIHADVPGRVEGNPVFIYHELFNPDHAEVEDLKARYRAGTVGDVEVKQKVARALNAFLEPLRARRTHYEAHLDDVRDILRDGTRRANEIADRNMDAILRHMGLFRP